MKKLFAKVVLVPFFFISICFSSSFAAENGTTAETSPSVPENVTTTEANNAVTVGIEETAVWSIIGGVIILGAIAISSESEDLPTAHANGHGH